MAHALVFGASGLNGWAVVNQLLLNYPKANVFERVTALTNRPLELSKSFWPKPSPERPQLNLIHGINLSVATPEDLAKSLATKVESVDTVTHVFFFAHQASSLGLVEEARINIEMLERAILAVESLTRSLRFVTYPGGSMAYGVYKPGGYFEAPLKEDVPCLPGELGEMIPYYGMRDVLTRLSAGKQWTWAEMIMDAIIGFAPNGSGWSLAGHWATWLSCYRLVEGEGAEVCYPGTEKGYNALFNEASSKKIARQAIWASLSPEKTGGQLFNVADRVKPTSHAERWPVIASAFGLNGVGPASRPQQELKPGEYIKKHGHVLQDRGFQCDLVHLPGHLDGYGFHMDFDRQLSMDKTKAAGFDEEDDPNETWLNTFDMFRKAGLLPRFE